MAWSRQSGGAKLASHTATAFDSSATAWNAGNATATPSTNDRAIAVIVFDHLDENNGGTTQKTVTSVTDSTGATWYKDYEESIHDTVNKFYSHLSVWSSVCTGGALNSITPHISGAVPNATYGASISMGVYSGLSTLTGDGAGVDIKIGTHGATSSTTAADSGTTSGTTSTANQLKIGAYGDFGFGLQVNAGTSDTTYSTYVDDSNNTISETILEDADSGAAGSTARATATITSPGGPSWQMAVLVYKLAGATGAKRWILGRH